jgi:fructose-1,6-bisphosphatase II
MAETNLVARPDRNLAMELVRATEAAAIRAVPFIGKGDKLAADGAAVDAMRAFLGTVEFDGVVVIGEGEKDHAPMLFNGEHVGTGRGPQADIAVDPIDGTSMTAQGRQNALSMIAVSDRGTMLDASSVFYMDKLVADHHGIGVISMEQTVAENIRELAKAKGKPIEDMVVAVLDRPRHAPLIEEIRAAGAGTRILLDGDVAGGINAARYETRIDLCGGFIEAKLAPKDDAERQRGIAAGLDMDRIYDAEGLVKGGNTMFVATGVTDGGLVEGVRRKGPMLRTESIVLRARSGTLRRISSDHLAERWL